MHLEKDLQLFEILLNINTLIVLFETYEWFSHFVAIVKDSNDIICQTWNAIVQLLIIT